MEIENHENEKIKAFLEIVKNSDLYITKEIYGGQITYALDKTTGFIHIIRCFKNEFDMDFITSDGVKAIKELLEVTWQRK